MTSFVTYEGDLRTKSIHLASKDSFITDAPIDNNGKGEAFSPTDIVASALASCILTIMGIKAKDLDIDLKGTKAQVTKVMASEPRRIEEIKIEITINHSFNSKIQTLLERAARNCPVAKSLHPDLRQNITFNWPA
tara:strand:+ start:252 stop:656 length:405 start_codon:yes stop_codon:yes gene_type:complete